MKKSWAWILLLALISAGCDPETEPEKPEPGERVISEVYDGYYFGLNDMTVTLLASTQPYAKLFPAFEGPSSVEFLDTRTYDEDGEEIDAKTVLRFVNIGNLFVFHLDSDRIREMGPGQSYHIPKSKSEEFPVSSGQPASIGVGLSEDEIYIPEEDKWIPYCSSPGGTFEHRRQMTILFGTPESVYGNFFPAGSFKGYRRWTAEKPPTNNCD